MPDIKGHRNLSDEEVALINEIKEKAEECGALVEKLRGPQNVSKGQVLLVEDPAGELLKIPRPDQRWVSIGATDLQTGFMALTRSVAKPESF